MPNTGSTAPDSIPPVKALSRPRPSCRRGRATAAPSGKFWMPMPRARAMAPAAPSPAAARAKARPTAMPSGTLCRVMAVMRRVFCRQASLTSFSLRKRGSRPSSAARNTTPSSIPAAAGSQPGTFPSSDAWSMAGRSRLHTEAAVITPAAKPSIAF